MAAERPMEMDEQGRDGARQAVKRRGLIAGAAAFVAGTVTVKQTEVARAGSDGDITAGGDTTANTPTSLTGHTFYAPGVGPQPFHGNPIFKADASQTGIDITAQLDVDGIHGVGKGTYSGVVGFGGDNSGNGVYGFGVGTGAGMVGLGGNLLGAAGVVGLGNGTSANNGVGVRGTGANGGVGVEGHGGGTNATGVIGYGGGSNGQGVAGIGSSGTGPGVVGIGGNFNSASNADGVQGYANGTGTGVVGHGGGTNATGVIGFGGGSGGQGVAGIGAATGPGIVGIGGNFVASNNADGVQGFANGTGTGVVGHGGGSGGMGVYGIATGGQGVRGQITGSAAGTIAVYGENLSSNTGGSPGNGGFGAYGFSAKGHGLVGATGTAGGGAVVGATNGVAGAYAAIFYGPVAVVGAAKSAAVKNADGSHSLLYCEESPESWFADYGEGQLAGGKAEVKIDPAFAAVADMTKYHVFLAEYGESSGLYTTNRTPTSFSVREQKGGASNLVFSYRIVGKRRDIEGKRLAKVQLPPEPARAGIAVAPPEVPTVPVAPPTSASPTTTPPSAPPQAPAVQPAPNPLPQPRP